MSREVAVAQGRSGGAEVALGDSPLGLPGAEIGKGVHNRRHGDQRKRKEKLLIVRNALVADIYESTFGPSRTEIYEVKMTINDVMLLDVFGGCLQTLSTGWRRT
jgi:hypothetical protein